MLRLISGQEFMQLSDICFTSFFLFKKKFLVKVLKILLIVISLSMKKFLAF